MTPPGKLDSPTATDSELVTLPLKVLVAIACRVPLPARLALCIEVCKALRALRDEACLWESLALIECGVRADAALLASKQATHLRIGRRGSRLLEWIEARGAAVRHLDLWSQSHGVSCALLARLPRLVSLVAGEGVGEMIDACVLGSLPRLERLACASFSSLAPLSQLVRLTVSVWSMDGYHALQQGVGRHLPSLAELRVGYLDAHDLLPRLLPTMARLRRLTIDELAYHPCCPYYGVEVAPMRERRVCFQRDALVKLLAACPTLEALAVAFGAYELRGDEDAPAPLDGADPLAAQLGAGGAFATAPLTLSSLSLDNLELEADAFDAMPSLRDATLVCCGPHEATVAERLRQRGVTLLPPPPTVAPDYTPPPSAPPSPPAEEEEVLLVLLALPSEVLAEVVARVARLAALALACSELKELCRARRRAETEAGTRLIAAPLGSAARVDWEIEFMGPRASVLYALASRADTGAALARAAWHLACSESVVGETLETVVEEDTLATWLLAVQQAVVRGDAITIVALLDTLATSKDYDLQALCDVAGDLFKCLTLAIHHGAPPTSWFFREVGDAVELMFIWCYPLEPALNVIKECACRFGPALEGEEAMMLVLLQSSLLPGDAEDSMNVDFVNAIADFVNGEQRRYPRLRDMIEEAVEDARYDLYSCVEDAVLDESPEVIRSCLAALRWRRVRRALQLNCLVRYWQCSVGEHSTAPLRATPPPAPPPQPALVQRTLDAWVVPSGTHATISNEMPSAPPSPPGSPPGSEAGGDAADLAALPPEEEEASEEEASEEEASGEAEASEAEAEASASSDDGFVVSDGHVSFEDSPPRRSRSLRHANGSRVVITSAGPSGTRAAARKTRRIFVSDDESPERCSAAAGGSSSEATLCVKCRSDHNPPTMNPCAKCGDWYHEDCHTPPLGRAAFEGDWYCGACVERYGKPARHR